MMLKDALEKEMKQDIDLDFGERMIRQRKLVELNSEMFPKKIVKAFVDGIDDAMNQCDMSQVPVNSKDILKGTRYEINSNPNGRLNAIFDDIGSLGKFSSPSNKLFD